MKYIKVLILACGLCASGCIFDSKTEEQSPESSIVRTGYISSTLSGPHAVGPFSGVNKNSTFHIVVRKNSSSEWVEPLFSVRFGYSGAAFIDVFGSYYLWDYRAVVTP